MKIKYLILLFFASALTFGPGCKLISKKETEDTTATDVSKVDELPESKEIRKWEFEITPLEEQVKEKEVKPPKSEFAYPRKKAEIGLFAIAKPEGEKIDTTFNFQNADIREVLNVILGDILEKNYTIDKRVTGMITLRTKGRYYKEELFNIVQTMLNINGFALVKEKNIIQVLPIQEARNESKIINIEKGVSTDLKDIVTQIVPLKHIAPQTIIPTLRGLLTKAGFVIAPNDTQAIIISEKISNIDNLMKVIETYDMPFFAGKTMKFYELKHANAKTLATDLGMVAETLGAKIKGPKLDISFVPFQEINKLLVISNTPEIFSSVEAWISNIDVRLEGKSLRLYVYKMQHEKAESTVAVLKELFSEKISPVAKSPEAAKETMKIIADKNTNSIIIKALPMDYLYIKALVETLDATPQQVLIEAIIAEVKLSEALAHGVEYFFSHLTMDGRSKKGALVSLGLTGASVTSTTPTGQIGDAILSGGTKIFSLRDKVDTIFNLIASETDIDLLSTPHILVRDGQTATIQVGQSEPIRSGSTTTSGGNISDQIQYRDTGTILTVTPHIGENNMVTLDITQEVSDAVPSSASNIDSPTFPIRKTKTSLIVKSDHTIYLGGIINVEDKTSIKKIPLLGDIPYIGKFFRSRENTKVKTELMVLITPHVINTTSEADKITKEFREKLKHIAKMKHIAR